MVVRSILIVAVAVVLSLVVVISAEAIPAFSRQYKAECTTCHTVYPELNEYGEVFLKNGYVYSHTKQKVGSQPAASADSSRNRQSGSAPSTNEGLLLSAIPEQIPLSLTATLNASYVKDARINNNNDFDLSTRALTIHTGGNFREMFGFYGKYTIYSEGDYNPQGLTSVNSNPNVPKNNAPDLTELFLVWRHALNTPVNLKIGRMRPKLSLWKSTNKVSVSTFLPHAYSVGQSPFFLDAPQDAVELNAVLSKRLFLAAGVVNRKGQQNKEGYGHVSYKIGGADYLGNEPEIEFDSDSVWDYLSVTFGAYGYSGRNADIVNGVADHFNDYYRLGMDIDANYKKLRLRAAGVKGKDSNPDYRAAKAAINSLALAAEAEYMYDTNIIGAFRYEYLFDQTRTAERHAYIPYIAYSPLQNIRVVLEYKIEDYVEPSERDNKIANLGLNFSF